MKIPSKPTYSSRTMRHLHWSCCFVVMCVWLLLFIIWVKWHSMSALSVSYVYSGSGNPKKNMTHQFRSLKQEFLGLVTIQIRPLYIFGNKATDGTHGSKYWFPGFGFHSGPNLQPCQCVVSKSKVQTYLIYFSSNTQQCNTKKEMPTLRLNLTDFDMWIRVNNLCLMTRSLQSGIRIWMIDVADVHSVVRKMHRGFVDFHHL